MSNQLISRNADLKRLRHEGYNIQVRSGYLLLRDVPYVNASKQVKENGILVSVLKFAGDDVVQQESHVAFFAGETPCDIGGSALSKIINPGGDQELIKDYLTINHTFSSKPTPRASYEDHYEKMTTYVAMLSSHAEVVKPGVTAQTFRVLDDPEEESVFHYFDSSTSRAEIDVVSSQLKIGKVAIVGVGGTGSYVLDLVAKTPVGEIHIFDGDRFWQHNAFRSPGAASKADIDAGPLKVAYFAERYGKMHRHIIPHDYYIDETTVDELSAMDFVFICVDKGKARKLVAEKFEELGKPFIDVGMGVDVVDDALDGLVRVTASTPTKRDHLRSRASFADSEEQVYATNIQIADLNALNAALAVIKWKKLFGFYLDLKTESFSAYSTNSNVITNDDYS